MPSFLQRLQDPIFQARVKPKTLHVYKLALQPFTTWAIECYTPLSDAASWDDALLEYRYAHPKLTKGKFLNLIAALEFFCPPLKRNLPWAHTMVTAWARSLPVRHTVALTSRPGFLIAVHFSVRGWKRLGLGMMVQIASGMRPNEMLQLLPQHVILPEEQDVQGPNTPTLLVLGVKTGTKVRRAQVARLPADTHPLPLILRNCKRATPEGMFLFPYTLADYRNKLRSVDSDLNINLGYTPHSPRAGFATEARLKGMAFEEIREAGRWQSDSSLRTYLDLVGATSSLKCLRGKGFSAQLAEAEERWPAYYGLCFS